VSYFCVFFVALQRKPGIVRGNSDSVNFSFKVHSYLSVFVHHKLHTDNSGWFTNSSENKEIYCVNGTFPTLYNWNTLFSFKNYDGKSP